MWQLASRINKFENVWATQLLYIYFLEIYFEKLIEFYEENFSNLEWLKMHKSKKRLHDSNNYTIIYKINIMRNKPRPVTLI